MGWENRNGKKYYYRKFRVGRRVVSHYLGTDLLAFFTELSMDDTKKKREEEKAAKKILQALRLADQQAKDTEELIQAVLISSLLVAGYHTHHRQWRKKK